MTRRLNREELGDIEYYGQSMTRVNNGSFDHNIKSDSLREMRDVSEKYGSPNKMADFICDTLNLDIPESDRSNMFDRIAEEGAQTMNIHFTPYENHELRKLIFIYEAIVKEKKNDLCSRLKLRDNTELCKRMTAEQVIEECSQMLSRHDIKIDENLKIGEKLTKIEDEFGELIRDGKFKVGNDSVWSEIEKGGKKINKSRRRNKSKSRRRNKSRSRRRNKSKRYKK